jgi:dihydroorotase
MSAAYDVVLQGGTVVDPSQSLHEIADVAFTDGKVVAIGPGLAAGAAQVEDVSGKHVFPGLVDLHAHFYYGVNSLARDPRKDFLPTGTTCAVDAGTSGGANVLAFREFLLEPAVLHLYAFLNISPVGMVPLRYVPLNEYELTEGRLEATVKTVNRHREKIVGIKLVLPSAGGIAYEHSEDLVKRAVETAAAADTRLMVHIDGGMALENLCEHLRPGDIITHCFQGFDPAIVTDAGELRDTVRDAVARGVLLDTAPAGMVHFAWRVAEACAERGIWPNTISTDYATIPRGAPEGFMRNLPEVMALMLHLGMPFDDVVRAATSAPAAAAGLADRHGSLRVGTCGDAAVFERREDQMTWPDMLGETRIVNGTLEPMLTVAHGAVAWRAGSAAA